MKIDELVAGIKNNDLVLPEFQREYVWSRDQAKQLLVSLVREYPVGGLLLWKTQDPPELKNLGDFRKQLGTYQVLLDGQQRLTTLYMLITGDIPPYYSNEDIKIEIRELCFNIEDMDFQYFQPIRMRDDPRWVRVVVCFKDSGVAIVFEIAEKIYGDESEKSIRYEMVEKYTKNLTALRNLLHKDLPVLEIPPGASLDDAIDVFDRVNSLGTKLTESELALTHVTGHWPEARRVLKDKIDELQGVKFGFDLKFMTRALVCAVTNHAMYEQIHQVPKSDLVNGWNKLSRMLDYITSILPDQAFIHSSIDLSSPNPLIPIIQFLSRNNGVFPTDESLRRAIHWFYIAQMLQRYTGQTDQRLEQDLTIILREESPWKSLLDQIADQRGRINVDPNDFEGRGTWHPLYKISFILAKAHRAIDWFNGIPLATTQGNNYRIHSHHIFPQSKLYENGFSSENHLHRQIVNAIANRAFLTGETNISISNRIPEEYLPEVEQRYPGALESQFVPMDNHLWKIENYRDFLKARRELISIKLNEFLDGLVEEEQLTSVRPVSEIISRGESGNLEFKSTLQWDVVEEKQNTGLRNSVLKTLVAFMNSNGGTLLIGVEDSGHIFGIEKDLLGLSGSEDRFLQLLSQIVADKIGPHFSIFTDFHIEKIDEKKICVANISKASEPAFMDGKNGREFYVRIGNITRSLDAEQTIEYIETNGL